MNRPSQTFDEWMAMLLAVGMGRVAAEFRASGFAAGRLLPYRFGRSLPRHEGAEVSWDGVTWERYISRRHYGVRW